MKTHDAPKSASMAQARELHSPRPRLERLALPVTTGYLWVMMILLGAIVLETFMIYPNIFSDPPQSLDLSMEFLSVDRKSTRLNSSHVAISYAVFCLKKKTNE